MALSLSSSFSPFLLLFLLPCLSLFSEIREVEVEEEEEEVEGREEAKEEEVVVVVEEEEEEKEEAEMFPLGIMGVGGWPPLFCILSELASFMKSSCGDFSLGGAREKGSD